MTNQSFQDANLSERSAFTFGTLTTFAGILLAMLVEFVGMKCFHRHAGEVVVSDAPEPEAQDMAGEERPSASPSG